MMKYKLAEQLKLVLCSLRLILTSNNGDPRLWKSTAWILLVLAKSIRNYRRLRKSRIRPLKGFDEKLLRALQFNKLELDDWKKFDIGRTVGIPVSVAKDLGLRNSEWISISYCDNSLSSYVRPIVSIVVQIALLENFKFVTDDKQQSDELQVPMLMSYSLFHNVVSMKSGSTKIESLVIIPRVNSCKFFHFKSSNIFRDATVVRLSKYSSSVRDTTNEALDAMLKDYLSKPRYLAIDNVIWVAGEDLQGVWLRVSEIGDGKVSFKTQGETVYRTCDKTSTYLYEKTANLRLPVLDYKIVKVVNNDVITVPWLFQFLNEGLRSLSEWWEAHCKLSAEVRARDRLTANTLNSQMLPLFLISGNEGSGKSTMAKAFAAVKGLNYLQVNVAELIGDTSAFTIAKITATLQRAEKMSPCLLAFKNVHLLGFNKEGKEDRRVIKSIMEQLENINKDAANDTTPNVTVIGITSLPKRLQECFIFHSYFMHEVNIRPMSNVTEVSDCIHWILIQQDSLQLNPHITLDQWILNSNAAVSLKYLGDANALISGAIRSSLRRQADIVELGESLPCQEICSLTIKDNAVLNIEDFDRSLDQIEKVLRNSAGSPQVPKVSWNDVGGLFESKSELIKSVELPLRFPHLFTSGLKRSGILLYGPPGTGKTLLAKAVASEFKLKFFSVKGPELLNMYVGQSEQNVREVFETAKRNAPCVLFFDELDSLAPNRGASGDSGGVMDRVVSQILAGMDGTHSSPGAFIIGATNRVDLIDPALLRPGRFDKLLPVGVGDSPDAYETILRAVTRKFSLSADVDFISLSTQLINGLSGADISSLCGEAYMTALTRRIESLEQGEPDNSNSSTVVTNQDFVESATRQDILIQK